MGWLIPDEPTPADRARTRRRTWVVALLIGGLPVVGFLAFKSVQLWAGAASDCEVFEAGDRFGAALFVLPGLSLALWISYAIPLLIMRRRSIPIGLVVGVVLALAGAYRFVSGTGDLIRADASDSSQVCPAGVPDWWPSWLPD
jgi:hypothetical protein